MPCVDICLAHTLAFGFDGILKKRKKIDVTRKNKNLKNNFFRIQQVKSRTKPFAYGLYWKHNRKQCTAFLSLDSSLSMDAHMKWVEWQIQNLEQYRKGE